MEEINWEAIHKAYETRQKGNTHAKQLAGSDLYFWADFYNNHKEKIQKLRDLILIDKRIKLNMGEEQDRYLREGMDSLLVAIRVCAIEQAQETKKKEFQQKKIDKTFKV